MAVSCEEMSFIAKMSCCDADGSVSEKILKALLLTT